MSRVCRSFCPADAFSFRIFFARRPPSLCRREAIKTSPDQGHRHPKPAFCRAKALLNGMRTRLLIPFSLFRPSSVKGRFGLAPTLPSFLPDGKNGFPRRPGPIPFSAGGAASASRQINKMAAGPHNQDARLTPVHLLLQSSHFPEGDPEFLRQLHRCGAPHLLDQIVEGDPE